MSSHCPARLAVIAAAAVALAAPAAARELRVCLDPNSMPFSNRDGQGFDNRIAALLARDLDATLVPVWRPQRGHGYFRRTLDARACDVAIGVPAGIGAIATTKPYYRSSFVFVSRAGRGLDVSSFDDARLQALEIGVPVSGEGFDTPPVIALARRGIVQKLRGYSIEGNYGTPDWQGRLVDAVAHGDVDLAIAWGPSAGYFINRQAVPLTVHPTPAQDGPGVPLAFDMSLGVRRGDTGLHEALDGAVRRNRAAIDAILSEYGVVRAETVPP